MGHLRQGERGRACSNTPGKAVHKVFAHWCRAILPSEILGRLLQGKRVNKYSNTRGTVVHELFVRARLCLQKFWATCVTEERVSTYSNRRGICVHKKSVRDGA